MSLRMCEINGVLRALNEGPGQMGLHHFNKKIKKQKENLALSFAILQVKNAKNQNGSSEKYED